MPQKSLLSFFKKIDKPQQKNSDKSEDSEKTSSKTFLSTDNFIDTSWIKKEKQQSDDESSATQVKSFIDSDKELKTFQSEAFRVKVKIEKMDTDCAPKTTKRKVLNADSETKIKSDSGETNTSNKKSKMTTAKSKKPSYNISPRLSQSSSSSSDAESVESEIGWWSSFFDEKAEDSEFEGFKDDEDVEKENKEKCIKSKHQQDSMNDSDTESEESDDEYWTTFFEESDDTSEFEGFKDDDEGDAEKENKKECITNKQERIQHRINHYSPKERIANSESSCSYSLSCSELDIYDEIDNSNPHTLPPKRKTARKSFKLKPTESNGMSSGIE